MRFRERDGALFRDLIAATPGRGPCDLEHALPQRSRHGRRRTRSPRSRNGARQIECTVNGIGERAGNTSLEEVVMAIRTRRDVFGASTPASSASRSIRPAACSRRSPASPIPINKPIVGDNAFAHEAGIHQDGVLKYRADLRDHDARDGRPGSRTASCSASTPDATPSSTG